MQARNVPNPASPSSPESSRRRISAAKLGLLLPLTFATIADSADFTRWVAESRKVVVANVEYAVVDVYAEFVQAGIQVVNAYEVNITNSRQSLFFQNDLSLLSGGSGSWVPTQSLELPTYGITAVNDSFVVIGGQPGGSNTTTLDPDFAVTTVNGVPTIRGGWYNSNPGNFQGQTDADGRTWFARFVLPSSEGDASLSWTGSLKIGRAHV